MHLHAEVGLQPDNCERVVMSLYTMCFKLMLLYHIRAAGNAPCS